MNEAKEHSIIFSGETVRAILGGSKTQTRRICKKAIAEDGQLATDVHKDGAGTGWIAWWSHGEVTAKETVKCYPGAQGFKCPYGDVGDRLWVREAIRRCPPEYAVDGSSEYVADGEFTLADCWPWKKSTLPSIHCPRGLSRITLEITGIRVEQLMDITEDDAKSEGIDLKGFRSTTEGIAGREHRIEFRSKWDAINGKRAPWDSCPWVWVIEFKALARKDQCE